MNSAVLKQTGRAGRLRQIRKKGQAEWRKTAKRVMAVLTAVVLTGTTWNLLPGTVKAAPDDPEAPGGAMKASDPLPAPNVSLFVPDNKVPTYEYQIPQKFILRVKNNENKSGGKEIKNVTVSPKLQGEDSSKWPFKTNWQNYSQNLGTIKPGCESGDAEFEFVERDDVSNSRYALVFEYSFEYEDKGDTKTAKDSETFYVNTTAKPAQTDQKSEKKSKKTESSGISNSEASYSGGGGSDSNSSVPRVIVTGFDTNPSEVRAGSDFTLTVHLKNTSKKSQVKNMLFDLTSPEEGADEASTAPAFLPSSGSSSVYLDGIKANGAADISMKLNAKSDLLQKPYSVELSMKYEDSSGSEIESTSSLSIPVKQDARFEFSDFEITPESIAVGDEANVMCSLYNLGRIKLYNVRAVFEGNSIEREEVFVGNVESGATASIDAMLKGAQATAGPEPITMTMSYENEEGEEITEQKELMLDVLEEMDEGIEPAMLIEEESSGGFPIVPVVIAIVVIALAAIVIINIRKKRLGMTEEEDYL